MGFQEWLRINGFIMIYAALKRFTGVFVGEILSTLLLFSFMQPKKARIQSGQRIPRGSLVFFGTSMSVKALSHALIPDHCGVPWLWFGLHCFIFELVFDLFHYWMHRLMHSHKCLYRFHRVHHVYKAPSALTTFHIDPLDLVLSYSIPLFFTCYLFPCSSLQLSILSTYLTYQEISGHLGLKMAPTSCFAQCIWVPRKLGIELYTEDHDLHHREPGVNFSKRFSLWDRLHGTFKPGNPQVDHEP